MNYKLNNLAVLTGGCLYSRLRQRVSTTANHNVRAADYTECAGLRVVLIQWRRQ